VGDDGLLGAIVRELEREGFRVIGADQLLDRAELPAGPLGRVRPHAPTESDIAHGMRLARAIGALDIGQAVVVQQGLVLGVEAIEGTDGLLRRCADLRRDGPGGVLVKVVRGRTMVAAIRPGGKPEGVWALPKGNLDPGEGPEQTALREVLEVAGFPVARVA